MSPTPDDPLGTFDNCTVLIPCGSYDVEADGLRPDTSHRQDDEHAADGVLADLPDLDGQFKVGRPWNAYWLDSLLARLEDPGAPVWDIEPRRGRS